MSQISEVAARMKLESPVMAATPVEQRNDALARIKEALLAHADDIFAANAEDLAAAERDGVAPAIVKRLRFDEHKLADVTAGIEGLIGLPDPVGRILLKPAACSAVMGLSAWACFGLGRRLIPVPGRVGMLGAMLLAMIAAVVVYVVCIIALRAITREDMELIPKGEKIASLLHIK